MKRNLEGMPSREIPEIQAWLEELEGEVYAAGERLQAWVAAKLTEQMLAQLQMRQHAHAYDHLPPFDQGRDA